MQSPTNFMHHTHSHTYRGGAQSLYSPSPLSPRKEDPLPSQGLLSSRSCILGQRPILLATCSHRLNPLGVS